MTQQFSWLLPKINENAFIRTFYTGVHGGFVHNSYKGEMAWVFIGEGCQTTKKSSYQISTQTNLKSNWGLDGWLSRYEHRLLFQRTWVWFPAPTLMAHTHLGFQVHGIRQPSRMYMEDTSLVVWNVHKREIDGIGRLRVAQGCCRWVWSFLKVTEWCTVSLWSFLYHSMNIPKH